MHSTQSVHYCEISYFLFQQEAEFMEEERKDNVFLGSMQKHEI